MSGLLAISGALSMRMCIAAITKFPKFRGSKGVRHPKEIKLLVSVVSAFRCGANISTERLNQEEET